MSLLPGQILPADTPLGTVNKNGSITISKEWWLLLYNVCQQTIGTGATGSAGSGGSTGGITTVNLTTINQSDQDANDVDAAALRQPIANLAVQLDIDPYQSEHDFPGIAKALLLAQDPFLQDPPAQAQPALAITPGASPYAYTAPFNGQVIVTGGVVSVISITRQGAVIATGLTDGMIMVSRLDIVTVTYASVPTMTFLPT